MEFPSQKPFHIKKIKQAVEPVNQQGFPIRRFHRNLPFFPASEEAPVGHGGHQGASGIFKELR